jgi:hypothetical protein
MATDFGSETLTAAVPGGFSTTKDAGRGKSLRVLRPSFTTSFARRGRRSMSGMPFRRSSNPRQATADDIRESIVLALNGNEPR